MKMRIKESIDKVLTFIRINIDASATVSHKTGETLIHYAVPNGLVHGIDKEGRDIPYKALKTMSVSQVCELCDDMEWTHTNKFK